MNYEVCLASFFEALPITIKTSTNGSVELDPLDM